MEVLSNTLMEDVTLQRNLINSEMVNSDIVMSAKDGKQKKKRKKGKNPDPLANVDLMEVGTEQKITIGSEMVHSNTVMSAKQEKKKNRKREKNSNALVNVDPLENVSSQRTAIGSEMVHSVTVMSAKQGKEKKRKEGKNSNALTNVDPMEDVTLQRNSIGSEAVHSDTVMSAKKGKRKKRNRGKNLNALANADPMENVSLQRNSLDSEMVHSVTVMSAKQGKEKKRKEGKNSNSLANVGPMEDVTLQRNSIGSEVVHFDTVTSGKQGKKKKREIGKNLNALANVDLIQQPIDGPCLVTDSRLENHDVEVEDCVNLRKTSFGNSSLSNDSNISGRDRGLTVDTKSTLRVHVNQVPQELNVGAMRTKRKKKKGRAKNQISQKSNDELHDNLKSLSLVRENPIHKVAGDGGLACSVDISRKMVMVPRLMPKAERKMKKMNLNTLVSSVIMPSTYVMSDSELMQHSAEHGVLEGIHLSESATKDKNCGGEDSSGINDAKIDEILASQEKAVGNMQGRKKRKRKIQGKNLNLKPEEGVISCNDLSEAQQVRRTKMDAHQNVGLGKMLTGCVQKKLLVLDLNGLLADVVGDKTVTIKADGHVAGKKIFKRPFCEDFLQFCFNRFTVGVWSSRKKENVDKVLQVLIQGKNRLKLAFEWNQSHCTRTGFRTIENRDKPLFLKELSKLWKNSNGGGDYDKSNTLLLDDSPYKALQNPPYTAIFPTPYQYQNQNDNALGPGGDLRVYLEGLALAEDVQKYVEQNPFGQKPITESDPSWSFYAKVICSTSMGQRNQHRN